MTEDASKIEVQDGLLAAGFVQIPVLVLQDPILGAGAKLTYGLLLWYAWKTGEYPGHLQAAEDFGIARRSLCRYLTELEQRGLLVAHRGGLGKPNSYTLPDPRAILALQGCQNGIPSVPNRHSHLNGDSSSRVVNEDDSLSLAKQVGERYGRNRRDAKALATSLSHYPEEAIRWATEQLENGLREVRNPAAWLNAVVPALAGELEEKRREELTEKRQRLVMIQSTARFYSQVEPAEEVRRRLLADFRQPGDEGLVAEVLERL